MLPEIRQRGCRNSIWIVWNPARGRYDFRGRRWQRIIRRSFVQPHAKVLAHILVFKGRVDRIRSILAKCYNHFCNYKLQNYITV